MTREGQGAGAPPGRPPPWRRASARRNAEAIGVGRYSTETEVSDRRRHGVKHAASGVDPGGDISALKSREGLAAP